MLQDKVTRCISLIDEVQANKERKEDNEKSAQKNNGFFDAYNKYLCQIISSLKAVEELPEYQFPSQLLDELKIQIDYTDKVLKTKTVVNSSSYKSALYTLFGKFDEVWKSMVSVHDAELLRRLAMVKPLQSEKKNFPQIVASIKCMQTWPITVDQVRIYSTFRPLGEQVLAEMDFDAEIESFLQKVSERRATISDLTQKVLSWIKQENLEEKFSLTVK